MAITIGMAPVHPGGFIRRSVLPDDLTVTAAAGVLGVGRRALSNLLNEKAHAGPPRRLAHAPAGSGNSGEPVFIPVTAARSAISRGRILA